MMKNKILLVVLSYLLVITVVSGKTIGKSASAIRYWSLQEQVAVPLIPTHQNLKDYGQPWVLVGIKSQTLKLFDKYGVEQKNYIVSTARRGVGELENSYQTPRGWHRVCEKIGDGAEIRTIIFHRKITPWKYTEALHKEYPNKDWILTRIMWLCGIEPQFNQGDGVDSHDRFIYIHGAGEHTPFGTPSSSGCVRMKNEEVINLFNQVPLGTDVFIDENS